MKKIITIFSIFSLLLSLISCQSNADSSNKNDQNSNIQMIDINNLLMSIPTIENTLPSTNDLAKESLNLEILEDDWRQLEFISKEFNTEIASELDSINKIFETESVEVGEGMTAFKNLHVRKLIPNPLQDGIEVEEFKKYFSDLKTGTLSFNQYGRVNNGIYFNISNFQIYALTNKSKIVALGFYGLDEWTELNSFRIELEKFMNRNNVVLVDWISRITIDSKGIDNFLKPNE
jgi:hypothetical protein